MSDPVLITALLAVVTFSIRFLGVALGQRLPESGPWVRALSALPGSLIVSLVAVMLVGGGPDDWIGAAAALSIALATRSLPLTMVVGIATVWMFRSHL